MFYFLEAERQKMSLLNQADFVLTCHSFYGLDLGIRLRTNGGRSKCTFVCFCRALGKWRVFRKLLFWSERNSIED